MLPILNTVEFDLEDYIVIICILSVVIGIIVWRYSNFFYGFGAFFLTVLFWALIQFYPLYVGLILFVIALIWFLIIHYIKNPINSKRNKIMKNPTFEVLELEPLHFAFSNEIKYKSSIEYDLYNSVNELSQATKKLYMGMILPWIFIFGLGIFEISLENKTIESGVQENVEGLTAVKSSSVINRKWGFIDEAGKKVIPYIYSEVLSFSEGLAAVKKGKWGFIDKHGNEVIPFKYNATGSFSEGLAAVNMGNKDFGKWGFIDKSGNVIISLEYDDVKPFSNGYARVSCITETKTDRRGDIYYNIKWGLIDRHGNLIVPCIYGSIDAFNGNLAIVGSYNRHRWENGQGTISKDRKQGVIDIRSGKEVIPSVHYNIVINEGFIELSTSNGERQYFDKSGNRINR